MDGRRPARLPASFRQCAIGLTGRSEWYAAASPPAPTDAKPVPSKTLLAGLETAIAAIDAEHKRLHDLVERLRDAVGKHFGMATEKILDQAVAEARIHFAVEESLMCLLSFPGVEFHFAEHAGLMQPLEKFRKRAQDFGVAEELAGFGLAWLCAQVDRADREFVERFPRGGINPGAAPPEACPDRATGSGSPPQFPLLD